MKQLLFMMIFACAAQCQDGAAFACNLKVFQPEERRQHVKLTHEIMAAIVQHQELPQGYSFLIDSARVSLLELAEWVGREKKCCPFFDFQIAFDGGPEGALHLALSGRAGVKQFILAEFHGLLPAGM
jgi:hypothetical protein